MQSKADDESGLPLGEEDNAAMRNLNCRYVLWYFL